MFYFYLQSIIVCVRVIALASRFFVLSTILTTLSSGISDFTDKGGEMDLKLSLKSPKPKGHNTTRTK